MLDKDNTLCYYKRSELSTKNNKREVLNEQERTN